MTEGIATVRVRPFFETFAARNAAGDVEGLLQMYAPTIMVAGPNGTSMVPSSALAAAVRSRKQRFEALGLSSATLVSSEATTLNDRYTLARTEWRFDLAHLHGDPVTLSSTFLLEHAGDATRIVMYMNLHDIMAVLRERGIAAD